MRNATLGVVGLVLVCSLFASPTCMTRTHVVVAAEGGATAHRAL